MVEPMDRRTFHRPGGTGNPDRSNIIFYAAINNNLAEVLTVWYRQHLAAGGDPDPGYADLIGEAAAEDAAGQHCSHAPGRA